jgi:3',5'-cyclic AMP phosphodiesterase CpdA
MKKSMKYIGLILAGSVIIIICIFLFIENKKNSNKDEIVHFTKTSPEDQIIYITSDIHYLSEDLTDHKEAFEEYAASGDGKQLKYIDEIVNAFSYDVQKTKPDILIISGDLTSNGEKKSHQDLAEKLADIEQSGTKVFVIPGNHDISNPFARGFKENDYYVTESIRPEEFSSIYADFGYMEAISKDENSLSYLAAPSKKVWLLMIDTNKYKNNETLGYPEAGGILGKGTLDWIRECSDLAKENGAVIITVMHHNILNHSEVIQDDYTLDNSGQTYIQLKENGLNLVFSGHIHVQDIRSDQKDSNRLYDIASGALSVNPHQYGILQYSALNNSLDYSTAKVNVEGWAKTNKSKDKNLLHFQRYAEDYFGKFAYDMAYKALTKDSTFSEEEIESMAETMKILNIRYFSGNEELNSQDVIKTEGYRLWESYTDSFLHGYILSITNDLDTNDNSLHIELGQDSR